MVLAKPFFDPIVVEDGKSNRYQMLSPIPPTPMRVTGNLKVLGESDDLLNQLVAPETTVLVSISSSA